MAQEQGVKLEPADILIVRTGWVKWYNEANDEDRKVGVHSSGSVGMGATMETVEWLWNHHFAAVASDNVAFEAWPPTSSICEFPTRAIAALEI
jgi:kynurenine formamidase